LPKSSFEVVTVNPPYKEKGAGLVSESYELMVARTELLCTLEDVITSAKKFQKQQGKFYMITRTEPICEIQGMPRCASSRANHVIASKFAGLLEQNR